MESSPSPLGRGAPGRAGEGLSGMTTVATARRLRRNETDAERVLWQRLRGRRLDGLKFKRQVTIAGKIADFACADAKLIIEGDGSQHADQISEDADRTQALEAAGYAVLRFWNTDVLVNLEGVLTTVLEHVIAARRRGSRTVGCSSR